ncbi:MAG: 16S rRNA (adenine(1518)-N(6)/adenine(1519)-N(6))-dimethyltransferase RsmA [Bacteroidales bacterium]|nr:16S rRNA (adenine(1518)-N(6)/adenine(1519)-N(6))-dimethyltransferase RsmA [Bacteroidales bacterium]
MYVKPKKKLGQHFLTSEKIAMQIAESIDYPVAEGQKAGCIEIGPGTGILTKYLMQDNRIDLSVIEIDTESVEFLVANYPSLSIEHRIVSGDFLQIDLTKQFPGGFPIVCGNFPYNISSQIFFRILDYKDQVDQVVCMIQREVAQRIANHEGTKEYGILSVFLQAYYDIEYLFGVDETVFNPPPKVKSAVIRLRRNDVKQLPCDEKLFRTIVKMSFNQRRKMLRNSLAQFFTGAPEEERYLTLRPEQLSVKDFVTLTQIISANTQSEATSSC